ncbi:MAG: 50S ribosomal protein L9, partial [Leptospiraceae bacterium]|nr:50S ribosomal protein L9 [Leptospiraceae bacterium]
MKVIFYKDVSNLGDAGDQKKLLMVMQKFLLPNGHYSRANERFRKSY